MARPDLDGGWFKVAYELLPPLMMCCQRMEASIVLCEVLAQTWGKKKLKTARLEPAKIAKRTGRTRIAIWKGIKELVDNGIIVKLGDGTYRFEKDYEKWGSDKKSLIAGPLSGYCADFPDIAKGYDGINGQSRSVPQEGTISMTSDEPSDPATVPYQGTVRVPYQGTVSDSPPIPPPSTCESIENGEVVVVEEAETTTIRPHLEPQEPKTVLVALTASELSALRPFNPEPAALERVKAMVDALDPMAFLTLKVEAIKTLYPLDWIEAAFIKAAGQANHGHLAHYANTLLIAAWRKGRWDEPEAFEPKPARPQATSDRPAMALPRLTPREQKRQELKAGLADRIAEVEAARTTEKPR